MEPRRIVVVDDNDDQVESLAMLLSMMGHEVSSATKTTHGMTTYQAWNQALSVTSHR